MDIYIHVMWVCVFGSGERHIGVSEKIIEVSSVISIYERLHLHQWVFL